MRSIVLQGETFRRRMEIVNPKLRALMGLSDPDEEAHHDVEVSLSRDPITLELCYTIAQVDESFTQ